MTVAGGGIATLDDNTLDGFMLGDGSAAIWQVGTALKTGLTAGAAKTLTSTAKSIIETSGDGKRMLFSALDPVAPADTVDIVSIDTTTAAQPGVPIVPTATVVPVGFSATGSHALYLGDLGATGAKLKAKLAVGGPEINVAADVVGGIVPPSGTGVVVPTNPTKAGSVTLVELSYVDIVAGGPPAPISDSIPLSGGYVFSGKKLVYFRLAATNAGIFVADLP